jgi:surface antigen
MRGSSQYNFNLKGDSNRVNIALSNTILKSGDFKATLYRVNSNGMLQQIPPTDYNISDNHITFNKLPKGKYMVKVDVNPNKASLPYEMVVNLDQAGSYFSKPDPLGMLPHNFGNIGGKRVTFNDHLGAPNGDIDAYRFTTDGVPRQLMLAVRDQKGAELVNSKVTVGLFDANNLPVSYKVVNGIIEANLKPNSQYYIKMTAQPGVGTNYQLVANLLAQSSPLQVPPGRHEYNVNISTHDVQGNKQHNSYNFKLENRGTLNWAIRDTTLKQGDFNFTLYKDGRQWGNTLKPKINEPLQFKDLPSGNYQIRVNVTNSSKNGGSYKTVFNLDEAGQTLAQARNLGKLTDQKARLTVNDHVGMPTNDLDYYKFSTDSNQRLLQFAVRHPSGNGSLPLEGNVEFILYDKNGKTLKTVNSANKKAIFDNTYELAPNSEYYVRVKAQSGNLGNYHLVLNGEVKRNPIVTVPNPLLTRQNASYFNARSQFYGAQGNHFAATGYGSSVLGTNSWGYEGNCTWYAYGRLKELGFNPEDILLPPGQRNAGQWGSVLKNGSRILGANELPRLGDIAQYLGDPGHVAIVEKVENGRVYLSQSNWITDDGIDSDGDGRVSPTGVRGDGTLHQIVNYSVTNPSRYIRLKG